jgi:SAM-dependent methyltransferase
MRYAWDSKPLLRAVYADFYARIRAHIDPAVPGRVVEIGSCLGQIKTHWPEVTTTDILPNPDLDFVCSAYEMPFVTGTVSHLVLIDVFHHLSAPAAFFREAGRVLAPSGKVILLEPYISWCSFLIYAFFHHEDVAWRAPINRGFTPPATLEYYAAQGNATRLFFLKQIPHWPEGWTVSHAEAFCAFAYLLSGGARKPRLYPRRWLRAVQILDAWLSRWPKVLAARCLVSLQLVSPAS